MSTQPRTWNRNEIAVLILTLADLTGFGMLIPSIQLHAEQLGAKGWLIGVLLSSMFLVQAAASPLWGRLSDKVGRKKVVIACTMLSAGSMLLYAMSDAIWLIFLSRILAGLGAANVATAQAALADESTSERRTEVMGRFGAAVSAGLILGPALGGALHSWGGARFVGIAAFGFSLSGLVLFWFAYRTPTVVPLSNEESGKEAPSLLRNRPLLGLFALACISWFALACLEGTFGRLIERTLGQGAGLFGAVFAYESLLAFGIQLFLVGRAQDRLGIRLLLGFSLLLQGLGLGAMPFALTIPLLFVASTVYSLGNSMVNPCINGWGSQLTPKPQQGVMFGMLQSVRSFGFFLGPSVGGLLFDVQPWGPYVLAAVVSALAAVSVVALPARGTTLEAR